MSNSLLKIEAGEYLVPVSSSLVATRSSRNSEKTVTTLLKEKDSAPICSRKLTRYENALLRNIWYLDRAYLSLLDTNHFYISKIGHFINSIEPEKFPATYQDTYIDNSGANFFIHYLFCSGQYLDDLSQRDPEQLVAYQLRSNSANRLQICVVRIWDREWNREDLIRNGAIDLTRKAKAAVTDRKKVA